jgi:dipeptidyl aminopeptidase/acylaminoacyl peptidase
MRIGLLVVAALSAAQLLGAQPAPTHQFGLDDFTGLRDAHAVAVAPDGKRVLYQVGYFEATGPQKHEWHEIGIGGDGDRTLTLPPHFTPSGYTMDGASLYGSDEVDGAAQLALVPLTPGAPIRVVALPRGMHALNPSPDGKRFAVLADPEAKDTLASVRSVVENGETSIYVFDADGTHGSWWCSTLHDVDEALWSPDGSRLAVISGTPHIGHHEVHAFIDVCDQNGAKRIAEIQAPIGGAAWGDNGKTIAFISTTTQVLTPDHVWTVPADGGTPTDRTPNLTGSVLGAVNDPQGTVWVAVDKGVRMEIDRFENGQLATAYQWPDGTIARTPVFPRFSGAPETLAFTVGDPTHTQNVAVVRGGQLQRITHAGDDAIAHLSLGDVKVVSWTAKDGTKLEGIATFPAGYRAGTSGPFVVLPHGGPEGNDLLELDTWARFVAGLGYIVLQPEYRGSTGYGSAFMDAIYQHFGDRAYSDVNSATDFAVAQGWADPNRLAIFGWSAGGFMTAWTVTQTHRYRAAIEGAGITDWLSFIPTSDIAQVDYDARLQEKDAMPFLKYSAVMFADRVTTPLLILHGDADQRVPTFQGRELYLLLAERGKTVRMVTYPGSPHFPYLAEQRRNVFQEVANWLATYNTGEQRAAAP